MPDELNYSSHLVSIEEALGNLGSPENRVVGYAWQIWKDSLRIEKFLEEKEATDALQEPANFD